MPQFEERMTDRRPNLLRAIPPVGALLQHDDVQHWLEELPRAAVTAALQAATESVRAEIQSGKRTEKPTIEDVLAAAEVELVARSMRSLRPVINATGIVLHTGLGRAPLCAAAIDAIADGASGYCNLEFDLESGGRGRRQDHVARRLAELTGAEAATVVNNNAAATLLILATLAKGREVIVSRGQLVEIGGSYRLPEVMIAGGATLREVGTTNRTRLADYEAAISDGTGMLLRVHPSNYRVVGFTEEAPLDALVELARRRGLVVVDDLGSGALFDMSIIGLPHEPDVRSSVASGADLVCFSGDKLLGGPQCGIIVGRRKLIERIESNPLMRACRVDKLALLALEATLEFCHDVHDAVENIPTLALLAADAAELAARAEELCEQLREAAPEQSFLIGSDVGFAGGGALPAAEVPTVVIHWRPAGLSATEASRRLREGDTPVVARIKDEAVCFDLRTLLPSDFESLVQAVTDALQEYYDDSDDGEAPADPGAIRLPIL
jgi:L-seryl-tRNA(Ser) seleniumtransferase